MQINIDITPEFIALAAQIHTDAQGATTAGADAQQARTDAVSARDEAQVILAQLQAIAIPKTVENYGAVGDGVADDRPAFTAMLAAEGVIRLRARTYNVNGLFIAAEEVVIVGERKPFFNSALTGLAGGSILLGSVMVRALRAHVERLGVDAGSTSGHPITTEGLVIDAPENQRGDRCVVRNVSTWGGGPEVTTHGLLVEGFDQNEIEGVDIANRYYGLVLKGRRGLVRGIRYKNVGGAAVFIKSDVPGCAGYVADATVANILVDGVIGEANVGDPDAIAVYVHASTAPLASVTIANVDASHGYAAVRVAGGAGTPYAAGVKLSTIRSAQQVVGVELFGSTYDVSCHGLEVVNPSSGKAFIAGGASENWQFTGTSLLISDPAILGTSAADLSGTGLWDNFSVRNPYRAMSLSYNPANITGGNKRGNLV